MLKKILLLLSVINILFLLSCGDEQVTDPVNNDDPLGNKDTDYWKSFTGLNEPVLNLVVSRFNDVYILDKNRSLKLYDGTSWQTINVPLENNKIIKDFVIDSNGQIYVAAGKIYISANKGASWKTINVKGNAVRLDLDNNYNVIGIDGSFYIYTTDDGYNWNSKPLPETATPSWQHLAVNSSGYIFYSTSSGVYRSTYYDDKWEKVLANQMVFGICVGSQNNLFLLTSPNTGSSISYKIFSSTDNGKSWKNHNALNFNGANNYGGERLVVNSKNYLYMVTKNGVEFSRDKGSSWKTLDSGWSGGPAFCITLDWQGFLYAGCYNGNNGGINKSTKHTGND